LIEREREKQNAPGGRYMMMPTQLKASRGSLLWAGDMGAVLLAVHLDWLRESEGCRCV
jgi:hypothetical protein